MSGVGPSGPAPQGKGGGESLGIQRRFGRAEREDE
jgi:hypothetical protein